VDWNLRAFSFVGSGLREAQSPLVGAMVIQASRLGGSLDWEGGWGGWGVVCGGEVVEVGGGREGPKSSSSEEEEEEEEEESSGVWVEGAGSACLGDDCVLSGAGADAGGRLGPIARGRLGSVLESLSLSMASSSERLRFWR
jgi:hypothetical protein